MFNNHFLAGKKKISSFLIYNILYLLIINTLHIYFLYNIQLPLILIFCRLSLFFAAYQLSFILVK